MTFFSHMFTGRVKRTPYFFGTVLIAILSAPVLITYGSLSKGAELWLGAVIAIVSIFFALVEVGLWIRRLHDMDKTGWLALLLLIPLVNIIIAFWMLFGRGSDGPNRFGPVPTDNGFFDALFHIGGSSAPPPVPPAA